MSKVTQDKYTVDIDERNDVFCTEENRVTRSDIEERFHGRISASSKLIAVIKAFAKCPKTGANCIKDMDMVEVKVNGSPFPG